MQESDQHTSGGMEQLLKKVYAAHKDILKGVTSNLLKYKAAYNKTIDKCQQLQKNNEELVSENRKLSTAITTTKQNRDGSCCEVIRQSLDTVISSYKQMLADKDTRISQLEEELNRVRRDSVIGSSKQIYEKTPTSAKVSPSRQLDQNPDSTSCITPKGYKQREGTDPGSSVMSPNDELVFDTSPDDAAKMKLNRKRSKRSRYSEDVSPDCKKPRKSSPRMQTVKTIDVTSPKACDNNIEQNKETRFNEQINSRKEKVKKGSGKVGKGSPKVLVSDTCVPDLNVSLVSAGFSLKNKGPKNELQTAVRKHFDTSVLVVPETLAMDMDDTFKPEDVYDGIDGQVDRKFRPELTDIAEDEDLTISDSQDTCRNSENRKVEKKGDATKEKLQDIPQSFRSILNGSESDSSEGKEGHSGDLDLDCDSLAKDSDDESFFDSLPNSQTFTKSKSAITAVNDITIDASRHTRNSCRNMKEVNALFETPESKGTDKKTNDETNLDVVTRKPLFRKGKKEHLKNEEQSEVVLRRSPRKHKPITNTNYSVRTPTKAKTRLNHEKIRTSPKFNKNDERESNKTKVNEEADFDATEADITMAPDENEDHPTEHTFDHETETIDCYNVMPVMDGNVDPSRKFQVKVKGIKKSIKSLQEADVFDGERIRARAVNDETLRSPSILGQECRSKIAAFSEVIDINSSNSGSNGPYEDGVGNSDIDSPLIIKSDKFKEVIDDDLEIVDWNSAKGRKKNSPNNSQGSLSLSSKRTSLRSSQQSGNFRKPGSGFVSKSAKSKTKGGLQTTLTQGFFSPPKRSEINNRRDDVAEEKSCKTIAIVNNSKQTSEFKSPEFKSPRKERLGRNKKVKGQGDQGEEAGQCDTTKAGHSVLIEMRDQSGNIAGDGRLNGSLDPSAELSEWCRDPETLQSLDTDFCEADLQTGVNSLPKTSTLAVDDTQEIPCSSASYKFLPKKHHKKDVENIEPRRTAVKLDDSFDRLPKKQGSDVAHVAVVRKRDERQKLHGHSCKECMQYYTSAGRTDEEIKHHMQQCSRHRAQFVPPDTPPHFWSIGFIETQEGNNTGMIKEDDLPMDVGEEQDVPTYRRRKRLNKYFKSKNERTVVEDDSQDTQ